MEPENNSRNYLLRYFRRLEVLWNNTELNDLFNHCPPKAEVTGSTPVGCAIFPHNINNLCDSQTTQRLFSIIGVP